MTNKRVIGGATVVAMLLLMRMTCAAGDVLLPFQNYAYGYNTYNTSTHQGYDGQLHAIGCGPTSGAMILDWWNDHGAPGLIGDPLVDARTMYTTTYMKIGPVAGNNEGFGKSSDFQIGLEQFGLDRGYKVDAVIHVEPTYYNPSGWSDYNAAPVGIAVDPDATFWDTHGTSDASQWTIKEPDFLDFIAAEIDAGKPFGATVASQGLGGGDHWMVGVGYDRENGTWWGADTWDFSLHEYPIESGFVQGNDMGVCFIRTFDFLGPVDGGDDGDDHGVPDSGATAGLLTMAFSVLVVLRRKTQ